MSSMQQSLKAGQTQAKTEERIESGKEEANITKDKAVNATQSTQESTHQTKHETSGSLQLANTEERTESGKERDKAAKESAHQAKDETPGFLQQTGEQMVHMAQGAVDTMKNTLGMNDKKN